MASTRSALVSVLILLVGSWVCPWSHLRTGCTCWSRCSVEALANCRFQALMQGKKGALGGYWQVWRVVSRMLTLVSALILLAGSLVHPWSHLRNGSTCWYRFSLEALANCRCQSLMGYIKVTLRSSWQAWSVTSARLTLVITLILLAGDFDRPWIHLSNVCTCWYRCNVEALANCRCRTLVTDRKGALIISWQA